MNQTARKRQKKDGGTVSKPSGSGKSKKKIQYVELGRNSKTTIKEAKVDTPRRGDAR